MPIYQPFGLSRVYCRVSGPKRALIANAINSPRSCGRGRIRFPSIPFNFRKDAVLFKPAFGIVLATALLPPIAFAEVVFSTASPDLSDGVNLADSLVADDFELQHDSVIEGIRFWTIEDASVGFSSVDWTIAASGGIPGQQIASGTSVIANRQATGRTTGTVDSLSLSQLDEYEQVLTFDQPVRLDAGNYWLLMDASRSHPMGSTPNWIWETSPRTFGEHPLFRDSLNGPPFGWAIRPSLGQHDMAFELVGTTVPAPSGLPLILVVVLLLIRKRRCLVQAKIGATD